jgi:hypothetical protein
METDNDEIVINNFETQGSSITQNKHTINPASTKKSSNKKVKQTSRKQVDENDSPTLKKLIMELISPEFLQDGLSQDLFITLQLSVFETNVSSLNFFNLYNKIDNAEDNLWRTTHDLIRCYYNFSQATKQFNHFRKTCNEDISNVKVNDKIMGQIPVQDKPIETNLRKRKERGKKVFRLFNEICQEKIFIYTCENKYKIET